MKYVPILIPTLVALAIAAATIYRPGGFVRSTVTGAVLTTDCNAEPA